MAADDPDEAVERVTGGLTLKILFSVDLATKNKVRELHTPRRD